MQNVIASTGGEPEKKKSKQEIEKDTDSAKTAFRTHCLNFYVEAAKEMRKRLPLGRIFQEMAFVDPAVLLSDAVRAERGGLADLYELTARFEVQRRPIFFFNFKGICSTPPARTS